MKQLPHSRENKWIFYVAFGQKNQVVTKYFTSFLFGRTTAEDFKKMLASLRPKEKYNLPWARLFNISTDGPNIWLFGIC